MTQTFAIDIERFIQKVGDNAESVIAKTLIDMATRLVERSPVGDAKYWKNPPPKGYAGGRFRANWRHSTGIVDSGTTENIDKEGALTIGALASNILNKPVGVVHYISNSLPYANRLENGWSRQAPNGMVALTINEFQTIVERIAGEIDE